MSATDLGLRRWKASIDEGSPDYRDHCQFCGAVEVSGPDGLQMRECLKDCGELVCANCAEVDYDFVGDPGSYRLCQWSCPTCEDSRSRIHRRQLSASVVS